MSSPKSEFVPDLGAYHLYDYYRAKPDPPYKLFDLVIAKQNVRAYAVFKDIMGERGNPRRNLRHVIPNTADRIAAMSVNPVESKNESPPHMDEHNRKALDVFVNQGPAAAARFMFQHPSEKTDSGSPRKMSYAEMRSYYG